MPDIPAQINALVNIVLGGMLFVWALKCSKYSSTPFGKYIRYIYALIGLCWGAFYLATFLGAFDNINTIRLGQMIFRPMVTVTLATLVIDNIWRKKLNGGCK